MVRVEMGLRHVFENILERGVVDQNIEAGRHKAETAFPDLGIHRVGHLEAHLQRQGRLDQPGDDQAVGSLRRKHEMDTGGAA
jgi:hypothetical protein